MKKTILLISVLVTWACQRQDAREELFLDQEYANLCEGFEAIGKFALSFHLAKQESDFSTVCTDMAKDLAEKYRASTVTTSIGGCDDLEALRNSIGRPEKEFYDKALHTFMQLLDLHSAYRNPEETEAFFRRWQNQDTGLGIAIEARLAQFWEPMAQVVIEEVFENSPAFGILSQGDRILAINGTSVKEERRGKVLQLLREKDPVSLLIQGRKDPVVLSKRQFVAEPVHYQEISLERQAIGYIKVRNFTPGLSEKIRRIISGAEQDGVEGLLLDLRENPGGDMNEVNRVVDLFIDRGTVAYSLGNVSKANSDPLLTWDATEPGQVTDLPLVILVDSSTASAAEMIAGGLGFAQRGIVSGARTYGKWVMQRTKDLSPRNGFGGSLVITVSRVFLFNRLQPQARGITPHFQREDPLLELALQKGENKATIRLREEEQNNVIAQLGDNYAPMLPTVFQDCMPDIERSRREIDSTCQAQWEDCQKEHALSVLSHMIQHQPQWPLISLQSKKNSVVETTLTRGRGSPIAGR